MGNSPSQIQFICVSILSNKIVNCFHHSGNMTDAEGGQIDIESLLRLVYIVNVENFIMVYSPHSGRRSVAMVTEVEPPKRTCCNGKSVWN